MAVSGWTSPCRLLRDRISFSAAADYLQAAAPLWPGYDFEPEIAYYRARADGKRVCHACYEILPPLPGLRLRLSVGTQGGRRVCGARCLPNQRGHGSRTEGAPSASGGA